MFKKLIKLIVSVVIVVAVVLTLTAAKTPEVTVVDTDLSPEQRQIITDTEVKHELSKINESYFAKQDFTNTYTFAKESNITKPVREYIDEKIGDDFDVNSWKIWKENVKSLTLAYEGSINVGYNMDQVGVKVDNDAGEITITIPKQIDLIALDPIKEAEENGWLTKVSGEDRVNVQNAAKEKELKIAENDGIREEAENNFKNVVSAQLKEFGYNVVFK